MAGLAYGRLASTELLLALTDGPFSFLPALVRDEFPQWDLRFRGKPDAALRRATLYYAGYGALMIEARAGSFRIARTSHRSDEIHARWLEWRSVDDWRADAGELAAFVAGTAAYASTGAIRGINAEGRVQTALCARLHENLCVIDREADFHGAKPLKEVELEMAAPPLLAVDAALADTDWGSTLRAKIGTEVDALAIDERGRLLTIEVKPSGTWDAAGAPLQAVTYATMFHRWAAAAERETARATLHQMATQRKELGLSYVQMLRPGFETIPVVAVGSPADDNERRIEEGMFARMSEVVRALKALGSAHELAVWRVYPDGRFEDVELP